MGFPRIVGSKSGKVILAGSFEIAIPSEVQSGQTILVLVASTTARTATITDSSYTELINEEHSSVIFGVQLCGWYKKAEGDETSLSVNLDGATAAYVYYVLLVENLSDYIPRVSDIVEGESSFPNPGELSLGTTSNGLWLSVAATDEAQDVGFPTNYSIAQFYSSTIVGPTLAVAGYNLRASSENPGLFYLVGSDEWLAATIAFVSDITTWTRYSSVRERSAAYTVWSLPTDDEHILNTGSPEDLLLNPEDFDVDVERVQEHETVWTRQDGTTVDWTTFPVITSEFYVSEL